MPTYNVADPQSGRQVKLTGDSPPTEQELEQIFSNINSTPQENKPGLLKRGWNALAIPEQKSREGLQMLANMLPEAGQSRSAALNFAKGTPRALAETVAQAAPGFISRGSILTAGAAKLAQGLAPLAGAIGKGLGGQAESVSGALPGSITRAFKDPTLMFAKARGAASELYQAAKKATEHLIQYLKDKDDKKFFYQHHFLSTVVKKAL